jgi:hypothetical protein
MSGGSVFAITRWLAVLCIWIGAMAPHRLMGGARHAALIIPPVA